MAALFAGILFSGIGFIAFRYGRKQNSVQAMVIGVVLMVYPYFIANAIIMWLIGVALIAGLFLFRD